ncbi:hypothetical protein MRB53_012586 [Persea americana]|uniref:Uncharacterized protein n=1 Tax=Persea americana TaxID=3435 RepID=A0ACC2LY00_PERAE|nr:hypothetical protein MRB53_012586 [Persea americana]
MESLEALSVMNWSSFNGTVSDDEAEFMSRLLSSCPFTDEQNHDESIGFWSGHEATNMVMDYEKYYTGSANEVPTMISNFSAMDLCLVDEQAVPDSLFEEIVHLNEEMNVDDFGEHNLPNQFEVPETDKIVLKKTSNGPCPKKRSRVTDVKRNAKTTLSKKKQATSATNEEESNAALYGRSSGSYSSEDDSNTFQEINGRKSSSSKGSAALNTNGKARVRRGSATDPQSLYARKRRERINERLRILQNLVPNGKKVDISTMLEEAVQYVKFLQLQIKLLSSEDLWMYAPLAYKGMDIGLDLKISAQI